MGRVLLLVLTIPVLLVGGQGTDLIKAIREASLDASECYRVRDVSFKRDEAQIFLTDGYLVLGKAVDGRRLTAVFSAEPAFMSSSP